MIAVLCSKSERFNESIAKGFHDSGSSMYIFLDDLPSQTGACLNNGRLWKIAQKQLSLHVLQHKRISLPLEYRNHWDAMTVTVASMFQRTLSIRDFHVPLHVVCLNYDVLSCESLLSESIVVVIGMEWMASVRRNVHSLNSSLCR